MTEAATGPFEIRGSGWQVSFQRRVLDANNAGRSPNRGVLPYFRMGGPPPDGLILVPLADVEALWIAVTCSRPDDVRGRTIDGDPLDVSLISVLGPQSVLLGIDAVRRQGQAYPIDRASVQVAGLPGERVRESLIVSIVHEHGTTTLIIALAAPELYAKLSGRSAPQRSAPEDAYFGWRLP